jgi:hypothetical protein
MTGRAGMSREKSECLIRDAREQAIVKIATEAASETKENGGFHRTFAAFPAANRRAFAARFALRQRKKRR